MITKFKEKNASGKTIVINLSIISIDNDEKYNRKPSCTLKSTFYGKLPTSTEETIMPSFRYPEA